MKIRLNLTASDDDGRVYAHDVDVTITDDIFISAVIAPTPENALSILLDRMSSGSGISVSGAIPTLSEGVKPCNHVNVIKGRCVLAYGHEGEHIWLNDLVKTQELKCI
jgi:hypothetical protein